MATQGKGILGAPHGKIGSIHFYNRLGKSIVQSNSIPSDSYNRYYNFLSASLNSEITYLWSIFRNVEKNNWNAAAPPSKSGFEYFTDYVIELTFSEKRRTLGEIPLLATSLNPIKWIKSNGSFLDGKLSFLIDPSNPFWLDAGTKTIWLQQWGDAGFLSHSPYNFVFSSPQYYYIDFLSTLLPATNIIAVNPRAFGSTKVYQSWFTDLYREGSF